MFGSNIDTSVVQFSQHNLFPPYKSLSAQRYLWLFITEWLHGKFRLIRPHEISKKIYYLFSYRTWRVPRFKSFAQCIYNPWFVLKHISQKSSFVSTSLLRDSSYQNIGTGYSFYTVCVQLWQYHTRCHLQQNAVSDAKKLSEGKTFAHTCIIVAVAKSEFLVRTSVVEKKHGKYLNNDPHSRRPRKLQGIPW